MKKQTMKRKRRKIRTGILIALLLAAQTVFPVSAEDSLNVLSSAAGASGSAALTETEASGDRLTGLSQMSEEAGQEQDGDAESGNRSGAEPDEESGSEPTAESDDVDLRQSEDSREDSNTESSDAGQNQTGSDQNGSDESGQNGSGENESEESINEDSLDNKKEGTYTDSSGLLTFDVSCAENIAGALVIPASFQGVPVTDVDDYAFLYCAALTSVTLPDSVTAIGNNAFAYCTGLTSVTVEGDDVSVGRRAFYYCTALQNVSVTGNLSSVGEMAFANDSALTALPELSGVKNIGTQAFYSCTALAGISLPAGLLSVGDEAFAECSAGSSETASSDLVIPDSLTAENTGKNLFYGCTKLRSVTLPDSWTAIPEGMFYECWGLEEPVEFPDSLRSIGAYAFYNTAAEAVPVDAEGTLTIPEGVESIGESTFWYSGVIISLDLPDSLTSLGKYAFARCANLKNIDFPAELESIPEGCFASTAIEILRLPEGLKTIGTAMQNTGSWEDGAFAYCSSLKEVVIPEGVTTIGAFAFTDCSGVTSVSLPSTLTGLGYCSFSGCTALTDLNLTDPAQNAEEYRGTVDTSGWGSSAFHNCDALTGVTLPGAWNAVPAGMFYECENLTDVTISDGVQSVGSRAFSGCTALAGIHLPETITQIGESAFQGCTGLSSLRLPSGVTVLATSAFQGCTSLKTIGFPSGLTQIGESAFSGCSGLSSVELPSGLQSLGDSAFSSCSGLKSLTIRSDIEEAGQEVFRNCTSLERVTYASGTTKVGTLWFYWCTALQEVNLPSTMESIGIAAFFQCESLTHIDLPEGLLEIGALAFHRTSLTEVTLPSTLMAVYNRAFSCTPLVSVTIRDGIPQDAVSTEWNYSMENPGGIYDFETRETLRAGDLTGSFAGCENLREINIPSGWTAIPKRFLQDCTGPLGTITIPEGVTSIGAYAFSGCSGLTGIDLPDSLTSVGEYAFYQSGLTSIGIPDSVSEENFGEYALGNCTALTSIRLPSSWTRVPEGLLWGNTSMTSWEIPEGIVSIGENAFRDSALESVTLPSTLQTIGNYAFHGSQITEVTIPGSVTEIEAFAFSECDSLRTVVLESGVTTLKGISFAYCDSLEEVVIPDSVADISAAAFYGSNPGKLHISCSAGSQAAEFAEAVTYVYSDYSGVPEAAEWSFLPFQTIADTPNSTMIATSYQYGPEYEIVLDGLCYEAQVISTTNRGTDGSPIAGGDLWLTNYSLEFRLTLVGCDESITDLVVPSAVCGMPVTSVSLSAYRYDYETESNVSTDHSHIRTITLGENVTGITVSHCDGLESIDFAGAPVTSVSATYCGALTSVNIPASVRYVSFEYCTALAEVTFQEGLREIGTRVFRQTALTEVWLPASLEVLQPDAFDEDVILHFTGDAAGVTYSHVGDDYMVVYDPVVPVLLQEGYTIAQFRGEGLEAQEGYYVPASAVQGETTQGTGDPYSEGGTAGGETGGAQAGVSATGDASAVSDTAGPEGGEIPAQAEDSASDSPLTGPQAEADTGNPDVREAGASEDATVFEVIQDTVQNNPWIMVLLIIALAVLAAVGGWSRYRKSRDDRMFK